jgi:cation diffusion facilitator family transporter
MPEPRPPAVSVDRIERRSMNLSLATGAVLLVAKWTAWMLTGSVAIFSDAAESVVHVLAVAFAWHAVRAMYAPPDDDHPYGHGKLGFFSSGVEGGLIMATAVVISVAAGERLVRGGGVDQVELGSAIVAAAGGVNLVLGRYLVRTGRRTRSIVLESNGQHLLTDAITSGGAVVGLLVAALTGLWILDPLIALLLALVIGREGWLLVARSVAGLMDRTNEDLAAKGRTVLDAECDSAGLSYHRFRLRETAAGVHVDFHLVFPDECRILDAHAVATAIEERLRAAFPREAEIVTHIEPRAMSACHE